MIRLGILGVVAAGLIYLWQTGKLAANSFAVTIKGYGNPGINGTNIDLPVNVEFRNPTPLTVNLDNVNAKIYINKGGQWVNVANINQPLTIPGGTTIQKLNAKIDLSKVAGGNLFETLTLATSILSQKIVQVKTDISATYGALTLPAQSFTSNIQVG